MTWKLDGNTRAPEQARGKLRERKHIQKFGPIHKNELQKTVHFWESKGFKYIRKEHFAGDLFDLFFKIP